MKKIFFLMFLMIVYGQLVDAQIRKTIYVNGATAVVFGPGRSTWGFDKIVIEGATGISWVKICSGGAAPGFAWETATGVIFDGVPFGGQEIICPKTPPPCEGCGPGRVTKLSVYVWGQGELRVLVSSVNYDNDNITEGQYINKEDPDGRSWGMGSMTLDPPNLQAGNNVNIRVLVPARMRIHVGRVELILPIPTSQNIYRTRRVTLNYDPDGIYEFQWTVPNEYFGQSNVWDQNPGIKYEVYGNKEDVGGQIPLLTKGATHIKVAGVLTVRLVVNGKVVPNGESVEWTSNRERKVSAQAMHGRGPYSCVWTIDGVDYPGTGSDYKSWEFKDQNVLPGANVITAVVTDANGNTASSTITTGVKTDMYIDMAVQGRALPLGGSTKWKKGSQRSVRANIHRGERPIKYRWIVNGGAYVTEFKEAAPQERFIDQKYVNKDSLSLTIEVIDANDVRITGTVYVGRNPDDEDQDDPLPTGPVGPAPAPPPLTGDPSLGANPDVDWDNRPWLDERVQQCAREYLQNIVLYVANARRKWENTGKRKSQQQPLFTSIDDWGRLLNQYITTSGGVDGNWDNPTHFVWSEFNKPAARNLCGRTVEYYVKYECNSLRPSENSLEAAINELADDGIGDPCQKDSIQNELLIINSGLSQSKMYYLNFIQYYDKIMKEINDQNSDPARNDMIAYSLVSANNQITLHESNMEEVKSVGSSLIARAGQCPDDIQLFEIIKMLSEVNTRQEDMVNKLEEITILLESFGVDIEESLQQGNQFSQQGADPNWVQDGGLGVELMGDGIDNIADGLQDEITGALVQGNVVIVLFDAGDVMDDVFGLYVDGRNEGDTPPGGRRTYPLNLPPGMHQVVIRGKKSDVGPCTYGIIIREGMNELLRMADAVEVNFDVTYSFTVSGI